MPVLSASQKSSLVKRALRYNEQLKSPAGASQLAYLQESRGFTMATIERFLLGAVTDPDVLDEQARGRISIPYLTPSGPVAMRFRAVPGVTDDKPKYWQPEGSVTSVFNVSAFNEADEAIWICEGEADTMTLAQIGLPAVGIPGASAWKDHYRLLFEGYERVIICTDNDDQGAGRKFAAKVASQVPGPEPILAPEGEDMNSALKVLGAQGLRDLLDRKKEMAND